MALGAALGVFGAGIFQINALERGQAGQPGEDVGEFLFKIGSFALAHGAGKLTSLLNQPPEGSVLATSAVLVEVDITDAPLELGDSQCVSIVKKRGESSKPADREGAGSSGVSRSDRRSLGDSTMLRARARISGFDTAGEVDLELAGRKLE